MIAMAAAAGISGIPTDPSADGRWKRGDDKDHEGDPDRGSERDPPELLAFVASRSPEPDHQGGRGGQAEHEHQQHARDLEVVPDLEAGRR